MNDDDVLELVESSGDLFRPFDEQLILHNRQTEASLIIVRKGGRRCC